MTPTTSERLEALLPKLRNICSGYRINADDAAWLEGLLHTSASLPEPGVVSEEAVGEIDWDGDAKAFAEFYPDRDLPLGAKLYLTPPTAPEAACTCPHQDANEPQSNHASACPAKEAAPAGEVET